MATDVVTSALGSGNYSNGTITVAHAGSETFSQYDPVINDAEASGDTINRLANRFDDRNYYGGGNNLATYEDAATIKFNVSSAKTHLVTLGGNRTLEVEGANVGDKFTVRLQQDSTGSRTVTWFDNINWAEGGTEPILTTTADKADLFGFLCTSGNFYDGFVIGKNI